MRKNSASPTFLLWWLTKAADSSQTSHRSTLRFLSPQYSLQVTRSLLSLLGNSERIRLTESPYSFTALVLQALPRAWSTHLLLASIAPCLPASLLAILWPVLTKIPCSTHPACSLVFVWSCSHATCCLGHPPFSIQILVFQVCAHRHHFRTNC